MTTDNVELQDAIGAETAARERFQTAETEARAKALDLSRVRSLLAEVEALLVELAGRVHDGVLADADLAALDGRYRSVQRKIDRRNIDEVSRKVSAALHRESSVAQVQLRAAESTFVEGASAFKGKWPAASGDLTTSIEDRAGYRALLEGIVARGMPEHEANFLKLLRDKSRDLIGHLASDIRDAPKLVVDRIDPVNASLGRSRFDVDRYLRIEVKTRRAPEVLQFMADLKTVVDGAWNDETPFGGGEIFVVPGPVDDRLEVGHELQNLGRTPGLDLDAQVPVHVLSLIHI